MAQIHVQKAPRNAPYFGLFQPGQGLTLAMKMASGVVSMQDVSRALQGKGFKAAYSGLRRGRLAEAQANLVDLATAARSLYFKGDQDYERLICVPIRRFLNLPNRQRTTPRHSTWAFLKCMAEPAQKKPEEKQK